MRKVWSLFTLATLLGCGGSSADPGSADGGSDSTIGGGGHFLGGTGGVTGSGGLTGSGGGTAVCTSGKTWSSGTGPNMAPGYDCLSCHSFVLGGTVYPTAHEPNNCDGTGASGLAVVITGADGNVVTLTPNPSSGNFYTTTPIKTPFTAKVTDASGAQRAMMASQTTGNCNSCHTTAGANGAPGRIMAP